MNRSLIFATMLLIAFAHQAHAQTVANGPYYATPSWDQTLPASTRFVVLANFNSNVVLDRETGLVWMRNPPTNFFSWYDAEDYCLRLNVGSRYGWRLPTLEELASLFDASTTAYPGLPAGHPFTLSAIAFWSAAPSVQFPGYARNVYLIGPFFTGDSVIHFQYDPIDGHQSKPSAWCVRGGPNVNPH